MSGARSVLAAIFGVLAATGIAAQEAAPGLSETITVTAARAPSRLGETAASMVVLRRGDLALAASPAVDDALRQVPGFTLFRRSSSRVANPTAQGVSLRGIGASGASRAIVLDDGIPLNDPFGGWIFWGSVPRDAVDRVEIVRGGSSDRYGSGAMGGVIQFVRRRDEGFSGEASSGTQSSHDLSLFDAMTIGRWTAAASVGLFRTAGYTLIERRQRGAADTNATSRHAAADLTFRRGGAFARFSRYRESRGNGTRLQTNSAVLRRIAAGYDAAHGTTRGWIARNDFAQTFSAVAADRSSERLTGTQRVPSRSAGANAQWFGLTTSRQVLIGGAELAQVSGVSDEVQIATTGSTQPSVAGGRQRTAALFLEDLIAASPRLSITASLRGDVWRNFDATRDGVRLGDRERRALSPRLAFSARVSRDVTIAASAVRAFRAPTLNELYRSFRVGNVVTRANERLDPETLDGYELGARIGPIRINAFAMHLYDTIANVTLSSTPALITRERQNVGAARTRGVEIEGTWRPLPSLQLASGLLYTDAVVTAGASAGKRIPQVPRGQATVQATTSRPRWTLALQGRWSSMQYDDDLNRFPLRAFATADAFASFRVTSSTAVFLAAENLSGSRIEASATPVVTLAQPRAFRAGIRFTRSGASTPAP